MNKSILFLSANDFKEKSIQVIKKTPEAYVNNGWDVNYIVSRDNSKTGNYFYEKEINPVGVNVIRFYVPFSNIKDKFKNHLIRTIISKILGFVSIFIMFCKATKVLKKKDIDVIYGYEIHGVLASNLIKFFYGNKNYKYVSRFQGTWITQYFKTKRYMKILLNFDALLAMKLKSDLCIMTDDGTQGDEALNYLKSKSLTNYKFWVNGVDEQKISKEEIEIFKNELGLHNEEVFLSVSRLEGWKRVDRALSIISKIKNRNIKYFIVGDGYLKDNLIKLAKELGIEDKVVFVGAIPNEKVKKYLNIADYFFSMYDLSNVGNPLLEAIRANKIIFTLNNGDTNRWIKHKVNGFIYDIDDSLFDNAKKDINEVVGNKTMKNDILLNLEKTKHEKLWTWVERMNAEVKEVDKLINV